MIAGIILLIILSTFGLFGFFRNAAVYVLQPVQGVFLGMANLAGNIYSLTFNKETYISKNEEMRSQMQNLAIDYVKFEALREEKEKLIKMIGYVESSDHEVVAAKVLTHVSTPTKKSILINKGSSDGIAPGMVVIEGEGMVLGRAHEVEDYLTWVRLITDPRSKIPVKVMGEDKITGIASGTYSSLLNMELIPQQEKIHINDLVVTSNLEEGIPENLLVGVINQIDAPSNDPFKSALVEPITDFKNLKFVSVIIFP
ncbi:rod shape-determining protein MreC [Patescibacteria group bacterium]|nr:rod shape-determining protein MreC [Patescibacteria group bacterium]